MATVAKALKRAIQRRQEGRVGEAAAIFREVLQREPEQPDALHLLGLIQHECGEHSRALEFIDRAIACRPAWPRFHYTRGLVLTALGQESEAIDAYRRCVKLEPKLTDAHNNLGSLLLELGEPEEAERSFRQALEIDPGYVLALKNLGLLEKHRGRWQQAEEAFRAAIEVRPEDARLRVDLAQLLNEQGRTKEAVELCREALRLAPDDAIVHNHLAAALAVLRQVDEAVETLRKAIRLKLDYTQARGNLAATLKLLGEPELAVAEFEQALAIGPDAGMRVREACVLPVIPCSRDHMIQFRRRFQERLGKLTEHGIRLRDPFEQVGTTNFYLAYQGLDDRELQEATAQMYLQACPELAWTAPHCADSGPSASDRPRLAIVSAFLHQHTIGKLVLGIVERLAEEGFHVMLFRFPGSRDRLSQSLERAASETIPLRKSLREARTAIGRAQPDILLYPDIGMEPFTYYLAFSRLAPVQCVSWGHPITTGIPNIDYFLSSELVEPEEGDQHYSERLVRFSRLPTYYYRPALPPRQTSRRELGLPEDRRLYVCPQSLMKFHPDFDAVLGALLRRDPGGDLVLVEGLYPRWTELLRERFTRSFPDVVERVRFLPGMAGERFLALLGAADAVLDPLHFGSGNSSYEAFALGAPIVTWPGAFMRGRVTAGGYRQMGVQGLEARDGDHYVELAFRLANDRPFREEMSAHILERSGLLFEDAPFIEELRRFFERALRGAVVDM